MLKKSAIITTVFFIIAIVVPGFLIINSISTYQKPIQENILTTFDQNVNGSVDMNAGGYSLNLAAPLGTIIPNPGFELVSAQSFPLGTSLLGLYALENSTSPMSINIYNENNNTLETSVTGNSVILPTFGGLYPIRKLVAQYSVGTFTISDSYLTNGINASIEYNKEYFSLGTQGYGFSNVNSPFEFNITPSLGTSESQLTLYSQSQYSGLIIYFSSSSASELNVNNQFLNTTGKIVNIGGFTTSTVQLSTFIKSNFTIPYDFITSASIESLNSQFSLMNVTGSNALSITGNGAVNNLAPQFAIQAENSLKFSIDNYIQNSKPLLKYSVTANFAQVFENNTPVFTIKEYSWPYEYRIAAGLIEGALIGGAITRAFDIAILYYSKRERK